MQIVWTCFATKNIVFYTTNVFNLDQYFGDGFLLKLASFRDLHPWRFSVRFLDIVFWDFGRIWGSKTEVKSPRICPKWGPKTKTAISRKSCSRVHGSTIFEVRRPRKLSRNHGETYSKQASEFWGGFFTFVGDFWRFWGAFGGPVGGILGVFWVANLELNFRSDFRVASAGIAEAALGLLGLVCRVRI